jgi:hypothetical protein
MARTLRPRAGAVLAISGAVLALIACNVFVSLDQCSSDSDCPSGTTCDVEGKFCLKIAEAGPPPDATEAQTDAGADVAVDAPDTGPHDCDPRAPFTKFSPVNGLGTVISARLTSDERSVLYSAPNPPGCTDEPCLDLWAARRDGGNAPFGAGGVMPVINCTGSPEYWPTLSADQHLIFFESSRGLTRDDAGNCTNESSHVWAAVRQSTSTAFGAPFIDPLFSTDAGLLESAPYLHPDGLSVFFVSLGRPSPDGGNYDIYVANIDPVGGALSNVTEIAEINTPAVENFPVITLDKKTLYFARESAPRKVWVTHRATPTSSFEKPALVPELQGADDVIPAWISDDMCRFYFTSNRDLPDGGVDAGFLAEYHLWVAERAPK